MFLVSDFSKSDFPQPTDLIDMLNNSKNPEVIKRLSGFDPTWVITYFEYPLVVPTLASAPTITSQTATSVTIKYV